MGGWVNVMRTVRVAIYINTKVKHSAIIESMVLKCKDKVAELLSSENLRYKVYKDDGRRGVGFNKMLDDIDNNLVMVVVTTELGRIATSAEDVFYFIRRLYEKRVRLLCADDSCIDTADNNFLKYKYNFLRQLACIEYMGRKEKNNKNMISTK